MDGYTKLHAKLVTSSIWNEPNHIRLLWITLLATADVDGNVEGSVGGLAHLARITPDECKEALETLSSPDPDSGDESTGERIRKVGPGVWHIINHSLYRDRQTRRQAQQAKWARDKRRKKSSNVDGVDASTMSTQTQTQYTEAVQNRSTPPPGGGCGGRGSDTLPLGSENGANRSRRKPPQTSDSRFDEFWAAYPIKQGKKEARAAWKKIRDLDEQFPAILEAAKATAVLHSVGNRKIKYPQGWLNGRRWEDELDLDRAESLAFGETNVNGHHGDGPTVQDF